MAIHDESFPGICEIISKGRIGQDFCSPPILTFPFAWIHLAMNGDRTMTWNRAEAKNRRSEVVNFALTEGPQTITRRSDTVVVISADKYAELAGQKPDFKEFLFQGVGLEDLDLTRDQSPSRHVKL